MALSTGIALGGVATCNLCTKTSCSAITPEEISELVEGNEQLKQLIEDIRQQDFYKDFVKGESKSFSIIAVSMQRNKFNNTLIEEETANADLKKALFNGIKALKEKVLTGKALPDGIEASLFNTQKVTIEVATDAQKVIDQYRKSSFCIDTITPLVSFIENYDISKELKNELIDGYITQLNFMIYLLKTDPSLKN